MFEITTVGLDLAKNVFQAQSLRRVQRPKKKRKETAPLTAASHTKHSYEVGRTSGKNLVSSH